MPGVWACLGLWSDLAVDSLERSQRSCFLWTGTVVNPMVPMIVNLNQDPQLQGRDPWLVQLSAEMGMVSTCFN